ncbi:hypothetical protein [Microbacterium arabinogalactanolyticum]|uniref:hypothetical protein n=1 Tax=Microbacterium arabinogalactanolyticum TaxID=69365 RepID=UPI0025532593|nr:hypothetical protein [Microbacterium arabinogalactanolyticum]GLC85180.1 hypothetical protein MIAR_17670 [Microbacterium arabinogalactanolyticum]
MSALSSGELAVVVELLGAEIAREDAPAIAAAITDLRAGLPVFRAIAAELVRAGETTDD